MEKVERYFYPAVFTCEPGQEIAVCFPDLGCATSGIDDQDALLLHFGVEIAGELYL